MEKLYSNEIVFRGHPDKVCDQISDALLDAYLSKDENSRCGIECCGGKGKIFLTGEVTSSAKVDVEQVVKRVLADVGYTTEYEVINNIGVQSSDIALGTNDNVGGAGDQGMMFGFACNETEELLPKAMVILQKLSKEYDKLRKQDGNFLADGKAQITGVYDNEMKLQKIKTFTISYQNLEEDRQRTDSIIKEICEKICKAEQVEIEQFLINPTGRFKIGGFEGDSGLTGRKIVVDNYHSFANVGGGAFSGKDATKVDRSAAYKAREVAKRILKEESLAWCEIQVSYAIGIKTPLAIDIKSNKGAIKATEKMYEEFTPQNIIRDLRLKEPNFEERAKFGHFID